ncbi:MAG: DUF72 domain-containing protein [Bradymonadaceae bacterium]|nr:DUF72 domain-containing protein [Lujinxingiaceae bacterium]
MMQSERVFLGTAGWSYDDWNGVFYPPGTSARDRLSYYGTQFSSVEIDSTFYASPSLKTVQSWFERSPEKFIFSAKFPRTITHEARLVHCEHDALNFVGVMSELGHKLGPLLLQMPPSFTIDAIDDLAHFFEGLPDGFAYAVEVRHRSWLVEEYAELLKRWNVAMVLTCSGHLERFWRVTSRIAYVRWLGQWDSVERFDQIQTDRGEEIGWWAPRIQHFVDRGGIVFGYVNNHYAGHAPENVRQIAAKLELEGVQAK